MNKLTSISTEMRLGCGLICAFLSLFVFLQPSASAVVSPYESALDLFKSGKELLINKEITKGISKLEKALPLTIESKDGDLVANNYLWLGFGYLAIKDIKSAHEAFDAALKLYAQAKLLNRQLEMLGHIVTVSKSMQFRDTEKRYLLETAMVQAELGHFEEQANALDGVLQLLRLPEDAEQFRNVLLQLQSVYEKTRNDQGIADTCAGLGYFKKETGDFDGALKEFSRAIATYRKLRNQKERLSMLLDVSAEALRSLGRYKDALPLQEEALSIRRILGDDRSTAQSLNDLALLYQELGQEPLAGKAIDEALVLTRKGGTKENLATALTNAASILRDLGRFDEGIALLDEVFKLAREEGFVKELSRAGQILATIYDAQGKHLDAAAAAMVAENLIEDITPGMGESTVKYSHNFAIELIRLGKHNKAIEIMEKELKKAEADNDRPIIATEHEGLALAYHELGQFIVAESHLLKTVQILEELQDSKGLAKSLSNLATIYLNMGRYYAALELYGKVSKIVAGLKAPRSQIEILLSMSQAYRHLKDYDQALDKAEEALVLSKEHGFQALVRNAQNTLGVIQLSRGDLNQAEHWYSKTSSVSDKNSLEVINEGLVEVYLATGRFQKAEEELARVTPELLEGADPGYRLQYYTQRGIARLNLEQGKDWDAGKIERHLNATKDFTSAISLAEDIRTQFLGSNSIGFFDAGSYGGRIRPYRGIIESLGELALSKVESTITMNIGDKRYDLFSAVFYYSEKMRSRNLVERLAFLNYLEARKILPESFQAEEKRLTEQIYAYRTDIARQRDRNEEVTPAQLDTLRKLQNELKAYYDLLRKDYPKYALLFSPSSITPDQVPLYDNEVLLEYSIGLKSVFLFVLKRGESMRLIRLPVSVADLITEVKVFRDLLVAKRFPSAIGKNLFDKLIGPALSYIGPKDALVVVPDGVLELMPFEALVAAQAGGSHETAIFLGTNHRISYARSSSILTLTRQSMRSPAEKAFFGLADPIFSTLDPRYRNLKPLQAVVKTNAEEKSKESKQILEMGQYSRLEETKIEVEKLASLMEVARQPPDVLIGENANETTLRKTDLGDYRIVHFATHAEALGSLGSVNEPFLVLGQVGNAAGHDGLLTMSEIMELKLHSDLVVLAACDTGQGDVFEGEGVASLASAFQFAGAESVVLSLWELPSKPALFYMETFYRYLQMGKGKAEALRLSRNAMRERYTDPYYWAVFVLYGDVRQ